MRAENKQKTNNERWMDGSNCSWFDESTGRYEYIYICVLQYVYMYIYIYVILFINMFMLPYLDIALDIRY